MSDETTKDPVKEMDHKTVKDAYQAVEKLREVVEGVQGDYKTIGEKMASMSGVEKELVEKIDKGLESYDEKNQALTLQIEEANKATKEFKERFENLEKKHSA